jgi:DNA-binding NarL/FixJ family response regulator
VDASPIFLGLLTEFLERAHPPLAQVVASERDGERGIDAVARLHPALAIVDLNMPGQSGLALIGRLRKAHPGLGIVAVSSSDIEEVGTAALSAGADAFVTKGSLRSDLPPALTEAVRSRAAPAPR